MASRMGRGRVAFGVAFGLLTIGLAGQAAGDSPLRALILSGGGERGRRETTPVLARILAETGRFDVRICEVAVSLSPRTLLDFDLVVDDAAGLAPGCEAERAIAG